MHLIINNKPVVLGAQYPIVVGVLAKSKDHNMLTVNRIIQPCDKHPNGLLIANYDNASGHITSWQEYEPAVIGATWKQEEMQC